MKKLLLVLTTVSLLLCSCDLQSNDSLISSYVADIKKQLNVTEKTDYYYTYQEAKPNSNRAYIIDFYVFSDSSDYSQWLCAKVNGKIDCDQLFMKHL